MRLSRLFLTLALPLLLSLARPLAAQVDAPVPLIVHADGDLWAWDGTQTLNRTVNGYVNEAALSPDGAWIAFSVTAPVAIEAIQRSGGLGGGALPADVHLMDARSGDIRALAVQPPDAVFVRENQPDNVVMRGSLAWSPDGGALAWFEYSQADMNDSRVMVYRLADQAARPAIPTIPAAMGVPSPLPLLWGRSGLHLSGQFLDDPSTGAFSTRLLTYGLDGAMRFETLLDSSIRPDRLVMDQRLAQVDGRDFLVATYNDGAVDFIDLEAGAILPELGALEIRQPQRAESFGVQFVPIYNAESLGGRWQIVDAQGEPVADAAFYAPFFDLFERIALSPDGQTVAFTPADEAGGRFLDTQITLFWPNSSRIESIALPPEISSIQRLLWGPSAWTVRPMRSAPPAPAEPPACFGLLPPRLIPGELARVIPGGGPNRIRAEASTRSTRLGQAPEGALLEVVDGPVCADGIVWWRVRYASVEGFTAESEGTSYYLEPA